MFEPAMDPGKSNKPASGRRGGRVMDSMQGVVEVDASGAYCRMPNCRFVHRVYRSSHFYEHFRKAHQEEALKRGLYKNVGMPTNREANRRKLSSSFSVYRPRSKLPLKKLVLEYVSMDDSGIHCKLIDGLECSYVQQNFNHPNFARHFCKMHPQEASEKGFCRGFLQDVLEKRALKSTPKIVPQKSKHSKAAFDHVSKETDGWQCQIAGFPCGFVQKTFETEKFRRHFRLQHPAEAKEYGFFEALAQQGKPVFFKHRPRPDYHQTEEQKTPSEDPSTYCRLCFSVTEQLVPIFGHTFDSDRVALIEVCTNVRLDAEKDGRSAICSVCCQKLNNFQNFRRQCQRLDDIVVRDREAASQPAIVESAEYLVEMIKQEPSEDILPEHDTEDLPAEETQVGPFALVMVSGTPYYKCSNCDTIMRLRTNLSRHWRRYHRNGDQPAKKVHCNVEGCTQFFMECKARKNHLQFFHGIVEGLV